MYIEESVESRLRARLIVNAIDEWSQDHNIPVRILSRAGETVTRDVPWTSEMIEDCDSTRDWCENHGVTLYFMRTLSVGSLIQRISFDEEPIPSVSSLVATNEPLNPIRIGADDGVYPVGGDIPSEIRWYPTDGSFVIGEVHPRMVCDWTGFGRHTVVAQEHLVGPIISALDRCIDLEFIASSETRRQEVALESLAAFSQSTVNRRIDALRDEVSNHEAGLLRQLREVDAQRSQLIASQRILDAAISLGNNTELTELLRSDYEALLQHPRITNIRIENEVMVVVTTDDFRITRPDTGESRYLGQFELRMNMGIARTDITNLTTPRNGRQHPHVNGTTPCFGGHHEDFGELLRQGQLLMYFELLCQYLETLNLRDSWGSYGSYWFDVPDERPLEVEVTT